MNFINYPNDAIGDVLRSIQEHGSNMSEPMLIDFFISVPSKDMGDLLFKKINKIGFQTELSYDEEFEEWTCVCSKYMIPCYHSVLEIESELNCLAGLFDSNIDGFGSYGNVEG